MKKIMKSVPTIVSVATLVSFALAMALPVSATLTNYGGKAGLPTEDLETTITDIIQWVLGFLALVAVIMVIYGGFVWLTAAGNEERVASAKKVISAAIIGLVIILLAWAIVWFIGQNILNAANK